jgi:NhaP-type Na+/H+ or K+/H+ antiporter
MNETGAPLLATMLACSSVRDDSRSTVAALPQTNEMLTAVFVTGVFLYSLVSRRLEPTIITVPVIFTVVGFVIMLAPPWFTAFEHDRKAFLLIAEIGLVMTLFTDASHVNLTMLRENGRLLARLLSVGMLLTIMLGVTEP